jgi:hypothetical protein
VAGNRNSVELVMLSVLDTAEAAVFYQQLGFESAGGNADVLVLERAGIQLVLTRTKEMEPDDGRPRLEITVSLDMLERVWSHDERDEPTLPGPTLSAEGAFEYRARDPSGNRVRVLAPLPEPGAE